MGSHDFETMAVRDGGHVIVIRSFGELRQLVAPPHGARPLLVAKKIFEAETAEQREEAVIAFRAWARVAGILKGEMA
jgi:hypothetical protein